MPNPSPSPRPKLAAVARSTGVSTATVSKVVNGRADVADETRAKVLTALQAAGYRSPSQRRAPAGPDVVEVAFDAIDSAYPSALLNGILDHAASTGVEVVVGTTGRQRTTENGLARKAQRLLNDGRAGVIVVTSAYDGAGIAAFRRRRIPVVVIDSFNPPPADVVSVGAANWAGGKAATEHLLDLGHRRIAYLGGPETIECNQARLHGYLAALTSYGVEADTELVLHGRFHAEHGAEGLAALLSGPRPPTAVFAGNDAIAVGVLREARRRGIRVPEDLSLVGFDGTALARDSVPALTSVAQPLQEMGRAALRAVLRQSRGEQPDTHRVELATRLVVRETTAPPR
ncbi:LacI family DNA-binding transcriptional regulator [Streptomyces sp. SDT5-1]|uniref:LacI family DNA-binding transcriptional regulator n=1 Tax=Streptomyces sp. SDT5-1 TaxID=3406418 RepID=UPI003FD0011F